MKKLKIFLLSLAAIIAVLLAIYVVYSTNKINKMIDDELVEPVETKVLEEDVEINTESVDALQESFDALFAEEDIESLYEGETDFGFIASPAEENE